MGESTVTSSIVELFHSPVYQNFGAGSQNQTQSHTLTCHWQRF
ncbi:hypothetical protein ACF3DV_25540 [Chlorogloeopsis fritschii PCC 9212]|nr:hypothetical protein [Chlorogloeopsis fritschii]